MYNLTTYKLNIICMPSGAQPGFVSRGAPVLVIIDEEKHGHVINPLRAVASVEPGGPGSPDKVLPPPPGWHGVVYTKFPK